MVGNVVRRIGEKGMMRSWGIGMGKRRVGKWGLVRWKMCFRWGIGVGEVGKSSGGRK